MNKRQSSYRTMLESLTSPVAPFRALLALAVFIPLTACAATVDGTDADPRLVASDDVKTTTCLARPDAPPIGCGPKVGNGTGTPSTPPSTGTPHPAPADPPTALEDCMNACLTEWSASGWANNADDCELRCGQPIGGIHGRWPGPWPFR